MAQTVADTMVAYKKAALDKVQKAKSKGGNTIAEKIAAEKERKANIAKAQQELDAWKAIASVQANRQQAYDEIVAAEEVEENTPIVEAPVAEATEEVEQPIAEEAETNQYPAPTRSEEGREETVATPVALAYLLEGGKGSIENAGYFLYGLQAAFPHIAAELQRVRDSIPSELLGMTPDSFVASNPHQLQEMRNFVAQSYGDKGVELFDKLTANSTGFIPREGKEVGLEIENLTPVEAQANQYDNQGNPIDKNGVKQASDAVNFSVNDAKGKGKKNTAFAESTDQFSADASSGSLVQSAHHSPTATLSVPSDHAKLDNKTQKIKKNIRKFKNGDAHIETNGGIKTTLNDLRKFFGMDYKGNSNYVTFNTPYGTMTLRIAEHNAKGDNFARDNSAMNVSVYIARNEYEQPESSVPFDEYRISEEDFNNNKEDFVKSLIESVDDALTTGEFTQPRHTEKVVEDGAKLWDKANAQAKANAEAVEAKRVEAKRVEAIKETAQRWSKKLGAKVQILESIDDVKNKQARQEIENAEKRGTRVRAWYGSKNGVTYVYLPHIIDEQEVSEVMAHEIVAHKGLKGLLGEEGYSDLCERVFYNVMTTEQQQRFLKYPGVNGNKAKATDEFIAHLAEATDVESQTAWQKLVDMLRVALEKLAEAVTGKGKEFAESFTNAEHLQSLLRESYRNMAKESQKMTEAQMRELESPVSVKNDAEGLTTDEYAKRKFEEEYQQSEEEEQGISFSVNDNSQINNEANGVKSNLNTNFVENDTANGILERISQENDRSRLEGVGSAKRKIQDTAIRLQESRRAFEEARSRSGQAVSKYELQIAEARDAKRIAEESNEWFDYDEVMSFGSIGPSGNEHDTYVADDGATIYKVNNLMNSRGSILSLLEKIELHNKYFPLTRYELVGFTGISRDNVQLILRQDYIDNPTYATPEEIEGYMQSLGFKPTKVKDAEFSNGEIIISDLKPRNVLKSEAGNIYVVDAEFKLIEDEPVSFSIVDSVAEMVEDAKGANEEQLEAKQNAIAALGGDLGKLRSAMARQRKYDKFTIEIITRMTKEMLDKGMLGGMSNYASSLI